MAARKIRADFLLAPGDTLCGTTALVCLKQQYPDFEIDVSGTAADAIYLHNPYITRGLEGAEAVRMDYPSINSCNQRPAHFIEGYCRDLGKRLGVRIDCEFNRPLLYLSEDEKGWLNQVAEQTGYKGKFWLVCSGIKDCFKTKGWGRENYQAVINALRGTIQFVQVGEAGHNHPLLDHVIDLRGKTDTRQFIRLCWHAQGGLGGISFMHHIFAAFEKPFVCVASGLEPKSWEAYNTEVYLTRQGQLDCCRFGGCWKTKVLPSEGADHCLHPVYGLDTIPKCMAMIQPGEVVQAIRSYYEGGLLSF